jgi:4-amino-4-deoxy-L-arabinose transferase-like glycosyltransferase
MWIAGCWLACWVARGWQGRFEIFGLTRRIRLKQPPLAGHSDDGFEMTLSYLQNMVTKRIILTIMLISCRSTLFSIATMPFIAARHGLNRPLAILIITVVLVKIALAILISLSPQEAYYWAWTQYPSLSYFDHPPLNSYSIALTTALFGNTVFGIKMAAVLWSLGSSVLIARLVIDMFDDRRLAFWAVLAFNLSLLYAFSGVTSSPDAPLLFGWIGTVWAVWRVRQTGQSRWWWLAGCFLGLALLSKYVGVMLVGIVGLYLLLDPPMRRWLLRPQPYLAVMLGIAIFSPVIAWNIQHHWVSISFQSTQRLNEISQMNAIKPQYIAFLFITQTLVLTPYLIWLALRALWGSLRGLIQRQIPSHALLLLLSAAVPLLVLTLVSFRSEAKFHWLIPVWWSLLILGMHQAMALSRHLRGIKIGLSTTALMLITATVILAWHGLPPLGELNTAQVWRKAGLQVDALVKKERQAGHQAFVFSPDHRISSLIWFYRPSQQRTHSRDIVGARALQYDYFPLDADLKGQSGIFVRPSKEEFQGEISRIEPYFDKVQLIEVVQTEPQGRSVELWMGYNYRGKAISNAGFPESL